jgi:hypothetical protein
MYSVSIIIVGVPSSAAHIIIQGRNFHNDDRDRTKETLRCEIEYQVTKINRGSDNDIHKP